MKTGLPIPSSFPAWLLAAALVLSAVRGAELYLVAERPGGAAGNLDSGSTPFLGHQALPAPVSDSGGVCFVSLVPFDDLWDEPGTMDVYCRNGAEVTLRSTYNSLLNPVGRGDCSGVACSADLARGVTVRQDAFDPLHLYQPSAARGLYLLDGMPDERLTPPGVAVNSPAVSANGRWCVLSTDAALDASQDSNGACDVYAVRLDAGAPWQFERISMAEDDREAIGDSLALVDVAAAGGVSYNVYGQARVAESATHGRQVVFVSNAVNLPGATDSERGPYVYLRQGIGAAAVTRRISVRRASGHEGGNPGPCTQPDISADGHCVVFVSADPYLATVAPATSAGSRVVVFDNHGALPDPTRPGMAYADVNEVGEAANGDSWSPRLSADGRFVVFVSTATNLDPIAATGVPQIFVRDRLLERTECLSQRNGSVADQACMAPGISPDGRFVTFVSAATNLALNSGAAFQVYLVDRGDRWAARPPELQGRRRIYLDAEPGGVLAATLHLGPGGALELQSTAEQSSDTEVFTEEIPESGVLRTIGGEAVKGGAWLNADDFPLRYEVADMEQPVVTRLVCRVRDAFDLVSQPWEIYLLYRAQVYDLVAGWNLLSLPFAPDAAGDQRLRNLSAWRWVPERSCYARAEAFYAGVGYWIYVAETPAPLLLAGSRETGDPVRIFHRGWQLVGPIGQGGAARVVAPAGMPCIWSWAADRYEANVPQDGEFRVLSGQAYWLGPMTESLTVDMELSK